MEFKLLVESGREDFDQLCHNLVGTRRFETQNVKIGVRQSCVSDFGTSTNSAVGHPPWR